MKITDTEVIWDLEEMPFNMAGMETARITSSQENKPITIKNVNLEVLHRIFIAIDLHCSIGTRLKRIEQKLDMR